MNINATLFAQLVVFFILGWFTMKFVWPPIVRALDERAKKISDGLAAADKAQVDLRVAERRAAEEMTKARDTVSELRAAAERQATSIIEQARAEAAAIVTQARQQAEAEAETASQSAKLPFVQRWLRLPLQGPRRFCAARLTPRPMPTCSPSCSLS